VGRSPALRLAYLSLSTPGKLMRSKVLDVSQKVIAVECQKLFLAFASSCVRELLIALQELGEEFIREAHMQEAHHLRGTVNGHNSLEWVSE
jgi:hypothetical protein